MGLGIAPIPFLIVKTMVYINSFDFNNEYNQITVDVALPQYELDNNSEDAVYISRILVGSQNAYDVESGEFDFEGTGSTDSYDSNFNITTYDYGWIITPKSGQRPKSFATTTNNGLPINTDNLSINDLYFIKIETEGSYSANTPCNATGPTWGSLYDRFGIDAKGMQYMKELADDCNTPTGMVDYILNKNAIDVAAGCGDYATMISRYNELMGYSNVTTVGSSSTNNYKKCGCNGY